MATASKILRVAVPAFIFFVAACTMGGASHSDSRSAYFAGRGKVAGDVVISLNDAARALLPENPNFDQDRLLAVVRQGLDTMGWLAKTPDPSLPTIEVVVTDIRVRSEYSAATMPYFSLPYDTIAAEVVARDSVGEELQRFRVSAFYWLFATPGGRDSARLRQLYETLATQMIKELAGKQR